MSKPVLKWSASHPVRAKDNLISSAAREKNQTGFKPSYESDPKQQMNFLMSNEYMRRWFKERGKYEKDIYSREETIKEESKIKRRVVQRMMTYRKPLKNDFIDEFIQKERGLPEPEVGPEKMKYKPECHHKKGDKKGKAQEKSKDTSATKEGNEPTKQDKGQKDTKVQKGAKGLKETKGQKGIQEHKEPREKGGKKVEDDDECEDVGGEIMLVCVENSANKGDNEPCKCEENKELH